MGWGKMNSEKGTGQGFRFQRNVGRGAHTPVSVGREASIRAVHHWSP